MAKKKSACTPDKKIAGLRKIVAEKQHAKVCGVNVDLFSASAIIAVHDKLNSANRARYRDLPVRQMASVAFKMLK